MATWPTTLPLPQVSGYSVKPVQAFLRTNMDKGAARQRKRFSAVPVIVSVSFMLTQTQFETFEAWWHFNIADGAGWFNTSLANGKGITTCEARFTGAYEAPTAGGLNWLISGTLEVRSMPIITEAELAARL